MPYFALFDDAVSGRAKLYQNHVESCLFHHNELDSLDDTLHKGWQKGLHAVLFADYEFGLPLMEIESERGGNLALHWFADCADIDAESWLAQNSDDLPAGISTPQSSVSEADYLEHIRQIHEAIRRGDTYQINYTTRLHLQAYGNPVSLYRRLRQPVPYAALSHLPDAEGQSAWTLCFSPELFLKIGADGTISTEPMKGTAPILGDGQDERRAAELQADPKNRAENVMIVDLLRNDLGKIAQTGKVCVPEPFKVSRFGSVWQMTSTIQAQALPHITAADILRAAFPCGSITGAPKRMSIQIIESLEAEPRGLYTGSIGYLNPCESGLGFEGIFNVVIRTLSLKPVSDPISDDLPFSDDLDSGLTNQDKATKPQTRQGEATPYRFKVNPLYQGVYGVGSGIVIDSDPAAEYRECGWKARFLNELRPAFGIFETMRVENRQCRLLDLHLGRLKTSAQALNLPLPDDCETRIRQYIADLPDGLFRLKAELVSDGLILSHAATAELPAPQRVIPGPDVPIAEHRQGCRLLETGDRLPVRLARIMLTSRSAVQGDGRDAGILRRARDVHEGLMIPVDADAGFNRHRHGVLAVRRPRGLVAGAHSLAQDRRQQILLPRQRRASAFARDLGRRTAEVEVDVVGQVLFDQDAHRRTRDRRVDPVELDGAHPLTGI